MQHNEGISANTEFEYLRNIMFQVNIVFSCCFFFDLKYYDFIKYLTGSANGNNETLVKVISAVLKFSPQQTQVALEKEHQRRSLVSVFLKMNLLYFLIGHIVLLYITLVRCK